MRKIISSLVLLLIIFSSKGQNVGIGTNTPNTSAKLEVASTNSGFLPPRMTFAQRNAILNPVAGLIIYCTDCNGGIGEWQGYNGVNWMNMAFGIGSNTTANLPSVTIGAQVWTTKNLDVAKYRNDDPIPQVTDSTEWANLTTGAWCWYNNDSAMYASTYGRLYNWYAVNDPRGLAPAGWHVPSDAEWNKMVLCIDSIADTTSSLQSSTAGGIIKETGTTHWLSPNIVAASNFGFAGLPGGRRVYVGSFISIGILGNWWSVTEVNSLYSFNRYVYNDNATFTRANSLKGNGLSVRLVKD